MRSTPVRIYRAVKWVDVQVIHHRDGSTEFVWPKKRRKRAKAEGRA